MWGLVGFYSLFFSPAVAVTKTTSKYIVGLQDPFKDKYMNGKSNYKLKSFKSMLATMHTMFVNKMIIRIYSIHHETHVRGVL